VHVLQSLPPWKRLLSEQQIDIDELKKSIDDVLTNLDDPKTLSTSVWLGSALVVRSRQNETLLPYEAVKLVFSEALRKLEQEKPEAGNILRKRYWDRIAAKDFIFDNNLSNSAFYSRQKDAKKLFTAILIESEKMCRQKPQTQPDSENNIQKQSDPQSSPSLEKNSNLYLPPISKRGNSNFLSKRRRLLFSTFLTISILLFLLFQFPSPHQVNNVCSVATEIPEQRNPSDRFVRSQGVVAFTTENTLNGIVNNSVRALAVANTGLWIGYARTEANSIAGIGHFDKESWQAFSAQTFNASINNIAVDPTNRIWIATQENGVLMFDGTEWNNYTTNNGLPSNQTYDITFDPNGHILVATWEGIAEFDGQNWITRYSVANRNLAFNGVHSIDFDVEGNMWVGYIGNGVSQKRNDDGRLITYDKQEDLGGNETRDIVMQTTNDGTASIIWVATYNGGISRFQEDQWTIYDCNDGLPSMDVRAVAVDKHNRVWAATAAGVIYYENSRWVAYDMLDTLSIAFGRPCENCPFDDDSVFTGTTNYGVTHSRVPYPNNFDTIEIQEICFITEDTTRTCPALRRHGDIVQAAFLTPLTPEDTLQFEIGVVPQEPIELREQRGDFLANTSDNDFQLFGTHHLIAVNQTSLNPDEFLIVRSNEVFTFADYNRPFIMPTPSSRNEQTFTSTWRVWTHTRYTGPYIQITFTVRND